MAVTGRIAELMLASNPVCSSDEERDERAARCAAAAEAFRHEFTPGQRNMLLSAASCSNLLFLALASGEWEKAVRALRGYVARKVPQSRWDEYRELIVALNVLTPNRLEGTVVTIDRTQPRVMAAA